MWKGGRKKRRIWSLWFVDFFFKKHYFIFYAYETLGSLAHLSFEVETKWRNWRERMENSWMKLSGSRITSRKRCLEVALRRNSQQDKSAICIAGELSETPSSYGTAQWHLLSSLSWHQSTLWSFFQMFLLCIFLYTAIEIGQFLLVEADWEAFPMSGF